MNEYEAKKQRRIERLKRAASLARQQAESLSEQVHKACEIIGDQPMLVGHHSYKRDRNFREKLHRRMRTVVELNDKAEEYERRAASAETNCAISGDDPDAVQKINDKIAMLQNKSIYMKSVNKLLRKNDIAGLHKLGLSDAKIAIFKQGDCFGNIGFASFELTGVSAEIRRLKLRLEILSKRQAMQPQEITFGEVKIMQNIEANRTQIYFPNKPDESVRSRLKSNGFKWAPSNGCWQRNLSNHAYAMAQEIVKSEK